MPDKKLCVRMLGGFSASYGNEVLTFGKQMNSKFGQLFQILMTRPGQGFSKREIMMSLYGQEEVEDSNASLNNTIFRLRRYLAASPLPPGDYITLAEGVLCFEGGVEVESDVWNFEQLAEQYETEPDGQAKADLCEKACELYRGEFLPLLSSEEWVIQKNHDYQKLYSRMLKYLLQYLERCGDYRKVEKFAGRGAKVCPFEEWEVWLVDSLNALGRHKEAADVYLGAAKRMQETGEFLSKRQQEHFRRIGDRIRRPEGAEESISRYLMEHVPGQGAYACTLPGFLDCFCMLKRIARRKRIHFSLLLCTISDANGSSANGGKHHERQEEKLCASFRTCLRSGDIYAKYSENQYLLLCVGVKKEKSYEVGARIDKDFCRRCGGRGGISCRLLDDGSMW